MKTVRIKIDTLQHPQMRQEMITLKDLSTCHKEGTFLAVSDRSISEAYEIARDVAREVEVLSPILKTKPEDRYDWEEMLVLDLSHEVAQLDRLEHMFLNFLLRLPRVASAIPELSRAEIRLVGRIVERSFQVLQLNGCVVKRAEGDYLIIGRKTDTMEKKHEVGPISLIIKEDAENEVSCRLPYWPHLISSLGGVVVVVKF